MLQAAFTNVRRERAADGAGPDRSPEERRALRRHAALPAVGRQRSVAAAPPVRASAVDPRRDRRAGAAHRRLERREPVPGADGGARARDGAAPVDRRRPRPVDPAGARRKRARRRAPRACSACSSPRSRRRRSSACSRRPTIRCISISRVDWRLVAFAGGLTAADDGAVRRSRRRCARRASRR